MLPSLTPVAAKMRSPLHASRARSWSHALITDRDDFLFPDLAHHDGPELLDRINFTSAFGVTAETSHSGAHPACGGSR